MFLKEAHRSYHEMLVEENLLDFTTIQREFYRLLHNEKVLEKLRDKIEYIMIDEYKIQILYRDLLLGEPKGICLCGGDDRQI